MHDSRYALDTRGHRAIQPHDYAVSSACLFRIPDLGSQTRETRWDWSRPVEPLSLATIGSVRRKRVVYRGDSPVFDDDGCDLRHFYILQVVAGG